MIVVLDTNSLHGDVYAEGGWVRALFAAAEERDDLEVWIPGVVVDGLERQFPERLREIEKLLKQRGHDLAAFGLERPKVPDIDAETAAYRQRLESRLTGKNRLITDPPPSVGNAVSWTARRRKPIKPDGTGAVDAAVWLTVVEAAKSSAQVVLVSNNHQDFSDDANKAQPHPTLAKDLEDAGISPGRVEIFPRILEFNNQYVKPSTEATREATKLLDDPDTRSAIESEISDAVEWFPLELEASDWRLDAEIDDAYLESFSVEDLELVRADPGPDGIYMTLSVTGTARFGLGLFKYEAYALPDDSPIKVYDYDWNESMAAAELETAAVLTVEVRHSNGDLAVSIDEVAPAA